MGDATDGSSWPKLDRTIDWAALGFLVAAPFSLTLSESLAILACLAWFARSFLTRRQERLRWPLAWPVGSFLVLSLISALTSDRVGIALFELRTAWLPWALFLLFANRLSSVDRMMTAVRVLIAAGGIAAIHGLVTQTAIQGFEVRVTGFLTNWMTFSGVTMVVFLLAVAQLLFHWQGAGKSWLVVSSGCLLLATLATHTRSAVLGLAAGGLVLIWFRQKRLLLALPVAGLLLFLAAPEPIAARWRSLASLKDVTAVERLYMWRGGLEIIRDHPWTGVGPRVVREVFPDYKHPDDPWLAHRRWTHLHSNPLQIAAERGVPALVAWCWIWVVFFRDVLRRLGAAAPVDSAQRACAAGSAAAVAAFLVMGLFEYNFGDTEVITVVSLVLALAFVRLEPAEDESGSLLG